MAAQIFNLGKLRFTYKGIWDVEDPYQLNDVVKYNNNLYVYINTGATTGNAPTNASYWSKMVDGYIDPSSAPSGQFLQTTGTAFQFVNVSQVPSQTGQAGKFLKTDGTSASWSNEFGTLGVTGDLDVGTTSGELYVGAGARSDATSLGTNVKTISAKARTSDVATITTTAAHGYAAFQFVTITTSPTDAGFDGLVEILSVPTTTTFTYASVGSNVVNTATGGSVAAIPGYTNAAAVYKADNNEYSQIAFRNANSGANASTDFIAYASNGTDFAGYIDMGITSSGFNDPEFTITGPNDGYIFMTAPVGSSGTGNLVLATGDTGTANKIVFAAGGLGSNNTQMEITPDVNVHIEIPTPSTSPTTGALTVVGGVGIQGDMNIQGDVSIQGTITFGGGGTTVETSNLAVTDPAIFVGTNNQADIIDLSFIGEYATTVSPIAKTVTNKALTSNVATLTTSAAHTYLAGDVVTVTGVDATFNGTFNIIGVPTSTTFTYAKTAANVTSAAVSPTGTATVNARRKFAGIARDASDGVFKLFKDATTKLSTTVNFSEAGLEYANLKTGAIDATGLTIPATTNLTVGAGTLATELALKVDAVNPVFTGNVSVTQLFEKATIASTAFTGTVNYDLNTNGSVYYTTTNASGNWVLNLRGSSSVSLNSILSIGQSVTIAVAVTQGSTAYYPTSFQVDGTASGVSVKWQAGVSPTSGSINAIDVYQYSVVKTANATYTVFANVSKFS